MPQLYDEHTSPLSQKYLMFSKTQNIIYKGDFKANSKTMKFHQQERASSYRFDKLRCYWINSLPKTTMKHGHNEKTF